MWCRSFFGWMSSRFSVLEFELQAEAIVAVAAKRQIRCIESRIFRRQCESIGSPTEWLAWNVWNLINFLKAKVSVLLYTILHLYFTVFFLNIMQFKSWSLFRKRPHIAFYPSFLCSNQQSLEELLLWKTATLVHSSQVAKHLDDLQCFRRECLKRWLELWRSLFLRDKFYNFTCV